MAQYSSESEILPTMKSLKKHAAAFIDIFDSRHGELKTCMNDFQFLSNKIRDFSILVLVTVVVTLASSKDVQYSSEHTDNSKLASTVFTFLPCIASVIIIIFCFQYSIDLFNLNIGEFRRLLFSLIVELGKLKQHCEDVKGSLTSGLETENLLRLEKSIEELLCQMEKLMNTESLSINTVIPSFSTDTLSFITLDRVQKEHVTMLRELEKMKVHLCIYRGDLSHGELLKLISTESYNQPG